MSHKILKGKTMVAIGDSLFEGNLMGKPYTWVNKMATVHGMYVYNYGKNGNTLAKQERETANAPMCERYEKMHPEADYVVVLGGANDKRLDVPIGDNDSTDPTTFKGALRQMILGLTAKYPKAKILFMTNYNRWPSKNALGLSDIDYVDAMLEICALYAIPCFDNYRQSGISFQNPNQLAWMDEGLALGRPENHHFTAEAYDWLLPKYAALLAGL